MSLLWSGLHLARSTIRNASVKVVPRFFRSVRGRNVESSSVFDHFKNPKDSIEERQIQADRTEIIPVETSIKYMESAAYKKTYGEDPIWKLYKRNFKGQFPPRTTRKTCIRNRMVTTGNPCPVCRDEYLVVDYRNTKLLKQFISEHTGQILEVRQTNVCMRQHKHIIIAIMKAKDYGLLTFDLPVRYYDYTEWYAPTNKS